MFTKRIFYVLPLHRVSKERQKSVHIKLLKRFVQIDEFANTDKTDKSEEAEKRKSRYFIKNRSDENLFNL